MADNHPILRKKFGPRDHYKKGYDSSKRTQDNDLDRAEDRHRKKYGDDGTMFSAGWTDYSADRPFGHSLRED